MLRPYDGYKETNIPWLAEIPSHWDVRRLYSIAEESSIINNKNEELLSVYLNLGVVSYKDTLQNQVHKPSEDMSKYQLVEKGDIVLNNQQAWRGSVGVSKYRGIVSPAYYVLKLTENYNQLFVNYLIRNNSVVEQFVLSSKGVGSIQRTLYTPYLKNVLLPIPPREEQDQIVKYLDWQTSKINTLIKAKKKQIELLKEQKQAVINKAVTKGLDDTVPMKDSGIEWLGEVPKHWAVLLNKKLYKENVRKFEDGETVLSLSQKSGLIPYSEMKERSMHTSTYENWKLVLPNDLVLNRFKAHLGVLFSSAYKGIVTFHYGVYEPQLSISSRYYELLYHTPTYCCVFAGRSNGMTVGLQNLSNQNFYNVYCVCPPIKEQQAIVAYLEEKTALIDKAIAVIEKEIELVSEYKTSLISSVVTGKVDVRGVGVPEFEVVEDILAEDIEDNEDEMEGMELCQPTQKKSALKLLS